MDEMESKLGAILNNPQMMQQIMALAQNFQQGESQRPSDPPPKQEEAAPFPMPDMATLRRLSGIANRSGIDRNQQSLLKALNPYLSRSRISRLEKAMRAAKMASMATAFLGKTGR